MYRSALSIYDIRSLVGLYEWGSPVYLRAEGHARRVRHATSDGLTRFGYIHKGINIRNTEEAA